MKLGNHLQRPQDAPRSLGAPLAPPEALPEHLEVSGAPEGGFGVVRALRGVGQAYGRAQIHTPEFKRWFGASKVVDATGAPLVVYHGTNAKADFSAFDTERGRGFYPDGAFFHVDPEGASEYALQVGRSMARVIPVYLSVQNPADLAALKEAHQSVGRDAPGAAIREHLAARGYDGMRMGCEWMVFRSEQIKSTLSNVGAFDPANPDLRA